MSSVLMAMKFEQNYMSPINVSSKEINRWPSFFVWLSMMAFALFYIVNDLTVVSDIQQFMPNQSNDKRLQVLLHETQSGLESSLILAQIEGADSEKLAQINKQIKRELDNNKTLFSSVNNGNYDLSISALNLQSLMGKRYLLRKKEAFTAPNLRLGFEQIINTYRKGAPDDFITYLLADPQQTLVKYLEQQSGQNKITKAYGVWFNAELDKSYLMIQMATKGYDLDATEQAQAEINQALAVANPPSSVKITLTGPSIFAVATRASIQKTTLYISVILTILVIVLFSYGYNSLPLMLLGFMPLLSAIVSAIALTQFIFSELHGIVLAFGITLLGVCIDYPLHLFSHIKKNESVHDTLRRIWPTLRLGTITSILAYVALIGTGFSGLTQLAVFSAIGLTSALLVTRWFVPVWITHIHFEKRALPIARPFSNRNKIIVSAIIIVISLSVLMSVDSIWSKDVMQISPVSKHMRDQDKDMRLTLHANDVSQLFLLDAKTIEDALIKTEQFKKQFNDHLSSDIPLSINTASDILPSKQQQRIYQSELPSEQVLELNVAEALNGLAFNKQAFDEFVSDVMNAKIQPLVTYQDIMSSPFAPALQSMLFQQNDDWYSLIRVSGVQNEQQFQTWLNQAPSLLSDNYLSLRQATNALMSHYLTTASKRLLLIFALILVVILWLTWKKRSAIWLLLPMFLSVIISLAIQILLGHLITIFHVLSLLLVIGMGIDYSLFFNRDWGKAQHLQDRTHAISISAITTVISFLVLAFSDVPVLAAMGQTIAVGILSCFLLAQRIAVPQNNIEETVLD